MYTCDESQLLVTATVVTLPNQLLVPKLMWVWARAASKKLGPPYLFLHPLKLPLQIWYTAWFAE